MSLIAWFPLNKDTNLLPGLASFRVEGGVTLTADSDGWYKVQDSTHGSGGNWGIYYDMNVKPNTTYTLVVYSKSTTGIPARTRIGSYEGIASWPGVANDNTGDEKKVIYSFKTGGTHNVARLYLCVVCGGTKANDYVFFKAPTLREVVNQGLSDIGMKNNDVAYDSIGKIGGSYYFNASSYITENTYDWTNFNPTAFSLACWYKEPSPVASGNSQMICIGTSSGWNNIRIGLLRRTSNGCPMFSVSDGTNNVNYNFTANSFPLDTWNHIVCTYNNGTMKMYLNGILHKTYTTTITPVLNSSQHLGVGAASNGAEPLTGYLNDVRIYDHCLSAMEVKLLSQGLVLHYPLADTYVEATTNLSNSKLSSSCYNAVTSKYSYGTNTDIYKESGTFEGRVCEKVHMGTNGLDAFPYVFFDYFQPPVGETRTLSFDYYPTIMDKVVFYTYNSPGSGNYTVNYKAPVSWSGSVGIPVQLNQWNHITITVTNTGSAASGYGYMQIGNVKHTSNTANYWLFGNIQVEAKDHATGYVGPNGTRSVDTVYDCSGFCNNGTISGNLVISNDTPKYNVSQYFNNPTGTSTLSDKIYISASPNLYSPSAITVGFWFKKEAITRGGLFTTGLATTSTTTLAIHDYDSGVKVISSDNTTLSMGSYDTFIPSTNIWYHYVITFDGINAKVYINGDLKTTKSYSGTKTLQNIIDITLGANSAGGVYRSAKGYYSDFRIYTTALSADDIKALYKNSAYIDNAGNVYGVINEV